MLYLITGANGAGKTLNTLKWVRERSLKENRPVCHNGRFEAVPGGELASWKSADFTKWQDEPDGTIFVVDECHNDLPLRPPSATPPEYIRMLAEHRRRGFDFYLITQHPQNIDAFVRRLIGSPGWHRHLKRNFGADLVSVLEWSAVNPQCEKNGSGKSGSVTMQAFPKEVYGWYRSASLHTGKKKIPKMVWFLAASVVLIPFLFYGAYQAMAKRWQAGETKPVQALAVAGGPVGPGAVELVTAEDSLGAYVQARAPRLPSLPHTAPIYDEVTKPKVAPYPAACVQMGDTCKCYSQQATVLNVDFSVCVQIVLKGFFVDWQGPEQREDKRPGPALVKGQDAPMVVQAGTVPVVDLVQHQPSIGPRGVPDVVRRGTRSDWASELAARNDFVRSNLRR